MKKIFRLVLLAAVLLPLRAYAADVGDIYFSDKTFATASVNGKIPVGMVYWVGINHGLIMQLGQPATMTWDNARSYCAAYTTLGTTAGTWRLPDLSEMIKMGKQTWGGGTTDNKFTVLNNKLVAITGSGQAMVNENYHTYSGATNGVLANPATGLIGIYGSMYNTTQRVRCVMSF